MADAQQRTASRVRQVQEAYRAGEGGYMTLARRFGVTRDTVRRYVRDPLLQDPVFQECGRKERHETASAAAAALARMVAERGTERERACQVYRCPHCAGFHVGKPADWKGRVHG